MKDFYEMWPEKFNNKTNGVTPRRFIVVQQPGAGCPDHRALRSERWISDLAALRKLEPLADDTDFHAEWRAVKTPPNRTWPTGSPHRRQHRPANPSSISRSSASTSTSAST